jgi:RNA polymerase sigma-70 factor (ECF subfamily)
MSATAAFDALYVEHARFVFRVLRGMGIRDAHLDDAVQDVFVVVHRRLPEFDGRYSHKTWLFEITFRIACDYRRAQKRAQVQAVLPDDLSDRAPNPAEVSEQQERLRIVSAALDRLADDKRATLVLADIEGMTAPEIATLTQLPLNTVYTRLRRARAEFSAALAHRLRHGIRRE